MPINPYNNHDGMGSSHGKNESASHQVRGAGPKAQAAGSTSGNVVLILIREWVAECEDTGISLFTLPPPTWAWGGHNLF